MVLEPVLKLGAFRFEIIFSLREEKNLNLDHSKFEDRFLYQKKKINIQTCSIKWPFFDRFFLSHIQRYELRKDLQNSTHLIDYNMELFTISFHAAQIGRYFLQMVLRLYQLMKRAYSLQSLK